MLDVASSDRGLLALADARVAPGCQDSLRSRHFAHLEELWGPEMSAALSREAAAGWASASVPTTGPRVPVSMERATGKMIPVATGRLLEGLHHALAPLMRALSARCVVPSVAAYGYYDGDDTVVLHVDGEQTSDLVLLIGALGDVGPLHLHPELIGATTEELGRLESDPTWDRSGGETISYPAHGATAIRGNVVPHHRPGRCLDGVSAVAALHYRSLF